VNMHEVRKNANQPDHGMEANELKKEDANRPEDEMEDSNPRSSFGRTRGSS